MDWTHVALGVAFGVAGWLVRHYQTPAHHSVIDDALAAAEKSKAVAKVKAVLGLSDKPGDPPAA